MPTLRPDPGPRLWALLTACLLALPCATALAQGHASLPSVKHVENLTRGLRPGGGLTAIALDRARPEVSYVGTDEGAIYRTSDGGQTWNEVDLHFAIGAVPPSRFYDSPDLELGDYIDVLGWPPDGFEYSVNNPSGFMTPLEFDLADLIPDFSLLDISSAGPVNRTLSRNDGWPDPGPDFIAPWRLRSRLGELRGTPQIRWLTIDPRDSDTVLAATSEGLYESRDGGLSWFRSFDSTDEDRRVINHVLIAPNGRRYVCTNGALLTSDNEGISYELSVDSWMARLGCNWTIIHPNDPRQIWIASEWGTWRSDDGGLNYDVANVERVPGQTESLHVAFAPGNPQRVVLVSPEAIFVSSNGGKTFQARGLYTFPGLRLRSMLFGVNPDHLLVASDRDLWESTDAGRTWRVVVFGKVDWDIQRMTADRTGRGLLVLTEAEIFRISDRPISQLDPGAIARAERALANEPSLSETVEMALVANHALRSELNAVRQSANTAQLLPQLQIDLWHRAIDADFDTANIFLAGGLNPRGLDTPALGTRGAFGSTFFQAMAWWDLTAVVFHAGELPRGRVFNDNERRAADLRDTVVALYTERHRLLFEDAAAIGDDARSRAMRKMRLEELTVHLNMLTNGLFAPQPGRPGR